MKQQIHSITLVHEKSFSRIELCMQERDVSNHQLWRILLSMISVFSCCTCNIIIMKLVLQRKNIADENAINFAAAVAGLKT